MPSSLSPVPSEYQNKQNDPEETPGETLEPQSHFKIVPPKIINDTPSFITSKDRKPKELPPWVSHCQQGLYN